MPRAPRPVVALVAATILVAAVVNLDKLAPAYQGSTLASRSERLAQKLQKGLKPFDQPGEAEEYHRMKRAPAGQSAIPVERYLDAAEHIKQMPLYSTAASRFLPPGEQTDPGEIQAMALTAWTPLGPGNIGGRTRALLIDPGDPAVMYAAGVAGGVWKSTDEGASWNALNDLLPNLAVCSMAFDPTDTSTVYAGTGEGFSNSSSVRGAGIFKTTDAGASWDHLASTINPDFFFVNDIAVSPNDHNRLYAATRTGVWTSGDGGASWTRSLNPATSNGATVNGGCLDLAIRTDQATDFVFASCGNLVRSTVYRNTDAAGAGSWTAVLSENFMARTSLAIAPSDQDVIYALSAASFDQGTLAHGLQAVYRSERGGEAGTWEARVKNDDDTKLNTLLLSNPAAASSSECNTTGSNQFLNQGWYDNVIAVDPMDPDRVWAGGIDLFRSDDGGANWGIASYWWAPPSHPAYSHADQHAILFHPHYNGTSNRVMYVASDGGVSRTDDARAATAKGSTAPCGTNASVRWTTLNNNYGVTQFYHGLPYPDGTRYLGGTQDNGTLRGSDATGPGNWARIFGGDGGYVALDPRNTNNLFIETTRLSIRRSVDGGISYNPATAGIDEPAANFLFINPFIMDPGNPDRLWTGGRSLWVTSSGGSSWARASAPMAEGSVSALAVAANNAGRVVAGTSTGFILRSGMALDLSPNAQWASARPRVGFVSSVAFDPADSNVAYATYSTFGGAHVWKSTDMGATWASIDGAGETAIPDIPVHVIVADPFNGSTLYVGTDLGVFVSVDGGQNWAKENTGFANVVTEALGIATFGDTTSLFAFTHGRGVWRVPIGPAVMRITGASVTGKKLLVIGGGFDEGATILVDGVEQKTKNVDQNPAFALIAKKGGKAAKREQTVTLQVRNANGTLSQGFSFTRP
jgi:hypothetical protein